MVKLDLCQALQGHRRAFIYTCFTSASCPTLEEQTPSADEPAEGVTLADEPTEGVASADEPAEEVASVNEPAKGVKVGNCRGEEGREDEVPSTPPDESSQSKDRQLPLAAKHQTKRVSSPLKLQQTLSPA